MKNLIQTLLLTFVFLLCCLNPVSAAVGDWLNPLPIDAMDHRGFVSTSMEWHSNYFSWDFGGAFREGSDYWKENLNKNMNRQTNLELSFCGDFRAETHFGALSVGLLIGNQSLAVASDSLDDCYKHLKAKDAVPGGRYPIGVNYSVLSYHGLTLGYNWSSEDKRYALGLRGNIIQGTYFLRESYSGRIDFLAPDLAQALIYQQSWTGKSSEWGYGMDFYGRFDPVDSWSIFFAWRDLGEMNWVGASYSQREISYQFYQDPNGNISGPSAMGYFETDDFTVKLADRMNLGVTYRAYYWRLTMGIQRFRSNTDWGMGVEIGKDPNACCVIGYDNDTGGVALGFKGKKTLLLLSGNDLNLSEANTFALNIIWII